MKHSWIGLRPSLFNDCTSSTSSTDTLIHDKNVNGIGNGLDSSKKNKKIKNNLKKSTTTTNNTLKSSSSSSMNDEIQNFRSQKGVWSLNEINGKNNNKDLSDILILKKKNKNNKRQRGRTFVANVSKKGMKMIQKLRSASSTSKLMDRNVGAGVSSSSGGGASSGGGGNT